METQSRKVELRSDGSIVLLSWFICVVAIIFFSIGRLMASEISTSTGTYHKDHTTQTHKIFPNIQKIVRTTNSSSRIIKSVKFRMN